MDNGGTKRTTTAGTAQMDSGRQFSGNDTPKTVSLISASKEALVKEQIDSGRKEDNDGTRTTSIASTSKRAAVAVKGKKKSSRKGVKAGKKRLSIASTTKGGAMAVKEKKKSGRKGDKARTINSGRNDNGGAGAVENPSSVDDIKILQTTTDDFKENDDELAGTGFQSSIPVKRKVAKDVANNVKPRTPPKEKAANPENASSMKKDVSKLTTESKTMMSTTSPRKEESKTTGSGTFSGTSIKKADSSKMAIQGWSSTSVLNAADANSESWKADIRAAMRNQPEANIAPSTGEIEDGYYRLIVKVPRVTKSYYDGLLDRKKRKHAKKSFSDSAMGTTNDRGKNQTFRRNEPCIPQPEGESRPGSKGGPKLTPTRAKVNLLKEKPVSSHGPSRTPSSAPRRRRKHGEEEVLSYFDPEMVKPEYKQLLEKSRNIVVGPPRAVLRKYFGYSKHDTLPVELRNDNSPKAFILPKDMWRDFDDLTITETKTVELSSSSDDEDEDGEMVRTASEIRLRKNARRKGKKGVTSSISEQQHQEITPLELFKQQIKTVPSGAGLGGKPAGESDPKSYERIRTKCERKKRRKSSFDEEVRKKKSDYEVICGSGSSSGSGGSDKDVGEPTVSFHDQLNDATEPRKRKSSDYSPYINREGSDLSIELGPDPMKRLPRNGDDYNSMPMYPTFSNEDIFDWYHDLNRLKDPLDRPRRRSSPVDGREDTSNYPPCAPVSTTRRLIKPGSLLAPRTSGPKPERPDYNTRDFLYDNARKSMLMPPKNPIPRYVDDRNGTTHLLEASGLFHKYIHRGDFGKIPEYLMYRNCELGRPPVPDFEKFYRFDQCKFLDDCTCCGDGDYDCDMPPDGKQDLKYAHSHSRLEDEKKMGSMHKNPSPTGQEDCSENNLGKGSPPNPSKGPGKAKAETGKNTKADYCPEQDPVVQYVVNRMSQLLMEQQQRVSYSGLAQCSSTNFKTGEQRDPNYNVVVPTPSGCPSQVSASTRTCSSGSFSYIPLASRC